MKKAYIMRVDIDAQPCRFGKGHPIKEFGESAVSALEPQPGGFGIRR
jgi:hypothetical protein